MPLLLVAMLTVPLSETIETTKSLELKARVVEAFELGPVIVDVSVTNRGNKALFLEKHRWPASCLITPDSWLPWYRQSRLLCAGVGTRIVETLLPGETLTERHSLSYATPGQYSITAVWPSWSLREERPGHTGEVQHFAVPQVKFDVVVKPATAQNRAAFAKRLEAEFAALPSPREKDGQQSRYRYDPARKPDAFGDLCEKVTHGSHRELFSLALRLYDRCRPDRRFGNRMRRELVSAIFASNPRAAHRFFVDRMIASPPADLHFIFSMWSASRELLADIGPNYLRSALSPEVWQDPGLWQLLSPSQAMGDLIRWMCYSAPLILPEAELGRLTKAKDFWVRAWTYSVFFNRLDAKWRDAFLKEAHQWVENAVVQISPPEEIDDSTRMLLIHLELGGVPGHRLLEVFAAGKPENPVCKEARDTLIELRKKPTDK
jgi:hypothetical protein